VTLRESGGAGGHAGRNFDRHAAGASGGLAPAAPFVGVWGRVNEITERQDEHVPQERIDALVARVYAARAEIVDRALDAVRADRAQRAGGIESP